MRKGYDHIILFEHQSLRLNHSYNNVQFNGVHLSTLQRFYGDNGVPYFSLIHNGVSFKEFVGVIQVGNLLIEILPKADNNFENKNDTTQWRNMLVDMLLAVGIFDIHAPSKSSLKVKPNSILDLYFLLFIKEVEYLLHTGLIKQYRREQGNVKALKGNLLFGKHIQQNFTHQERFYTSHTTYDVVHTLHKIIYKTLLLINKLNGEDNLKGRIEFLLLNFPEMPDINVTATTFERFQFTRKNSQYKNAIDIARLLLLHFHPDVSKGKMDVLALMFDMNILWEKFVFKSLKKRGGNAFSVTAQSSKYFWKPESGYRFKIRPDIVLNKDSKDLCIVLDTKWKNLKGYNPSPDDLRQMYVYHEYFGAKKVALVYPGVDTLPIKGNFISPDNGEQEQEKECSIIPIPVNTNIREWQQDICNTFSMWQII